MASLYTYTDFENQMRLKGLNGQISEADLALAKKNPDAGIKLLDAKAKWNTATDDVARSAANKEAEQIRSTYGGYTGGVAGAEWNINAPKTPSSFSSEYDDLINTEINNFKNAEFKYDPNTDPLYSSYKKTYTREGRRASEDAMAQAAAMTGGIPSSYAVMAGQQAGNYYASQMADKIPELEQMAYDRHLQDQNRRLELINLMRGERDTAYGRHIDDISYLQGEEDRAITQAMQRAELGDYTALEKLDFVIPDYVKNAGPLSYQWSIEDRANEAADRQLSNDLAIAESAAGVGDYSKYKALGITPNPEAVNTADNTDVVAEIAKEYGDTMEIPSNEMAAYLTKYPDLLDTLLANGYTILLSSAEVDELKTDYPGGEIPQADWDALIAAGYNEGDLKDNGFKRENLIYGH